MQTIAFRVSAAMGLLAVGLGAFGAHGLKDLLARNEMAANWETAVFYHLTHAVALLVIAWSARWRPGPWWCLFLGVVVFSGSLYVMGLTGIRKLGMVTPFGGVAMLVGWAWLMIAGPGGSRVDSAATPDSAAR